MIAGSVVLMLVAGRRPEPRPAPVAPRPHERPWLTHEAAAQIVAPGGGLGPMFADLDLGGSAPAPEVRTRIAEFARANGVDITFEVVDGELAAVRLAVTFGGCCGYEGADALGRQLGRPRAESNCECTPDWVDDWAVTLDGGVQMHARVRVNRVELRWEHAITVAELLDRTETLISMDRPSVARTAGDRWIEIEPKSRYLLEVPYPFARTDYGVPAMLAARDDLGLQIVTEHGRIAAASFVLRDDTETIATMLRARWGQPRVVATEPKTWEWHAHDRTITAELEDHMSKIVIGVRPASE